MWQQLILITNKDHAELLSDLLSNAGSFSISLEDHADEPLFEPSPGTMPLWQNIKLTALFSKDINLQPVIELLQHLAPSHAIHSYHINPLPEQDWQTQLQTQFQPIQIGEKLIICPSWHQLPPSSNAVQITLDPGLAFGTGSHPTTKLCLAWLERHIQGGEIILDYGCGSGILAIAALKLGAKQAIAVDHDPQALLSTRNNAALNRISEQQLITCLPEEIPTKKANIIVANIFANVLMELASTFAKLITANGKIVLSGILENQFSAIEKNYNTYFKALDHCSENDWILATFTA